MDFNIIDHLQDHPWPGCQVELFGMKITWMSSGIASMVLVATLLLAVIVPIARRRQVLPKGGYNVLELLTVFVRDMIARPALHDKAYAFLPLLCTLFVFVLGMNLIGLVPLGPLSHAIPVLSDHPIGATPTGVLTVCGALAAITLLSIVGMGFQKAALNCHEHKGWPMWLCVVLAPILWIKSLAPHVPGPIGVVLLVPLAGLELMGAFFKCFALMIRLFANMMAGHALLAALMMFIIMALKGLLVSGANDFFYIAPVCVVGSVLINIMELLVAALQAYIFTFLTAMFLNLYVEPAH